VETTSQRRKTVRSKFLLLLQVSADDRRHLCERTKLSSDVGLTAYGSVVYQLKDANMEASGTCDFVCRALRIVYKTGERRYNVRKYCRDMFLAGQHSIGKLRNVHMQRQLWHLRYNLPFDLRSFRRCHQSYPDSSGVTREPAVTKAAWGSPPDFFRARRRVNFVM
jgi:hypothetical protein